MTTLAGSCFHRRFPPHSEISALPEQRFAAPGACSHKIGADMPNYSQIKDQRFWAKWAAAGAIGTLETALASGESSLHLQPEPPKSHINKIQTLAKEHNLQGRDRSNFLEAAGHEWRWFYYMIGACCADSERNKTTRNASATDYANRSKRISKKLSQHAVLALRMYRLSFIP